ncbi:hypothetical protein BKP45_05375 [Anaerobacillus alkalidiazotrophicus]|uniref:DUF2533 domain-containing protein n=1 Tax=Anaerobacillus alkalidiazotrophicus TaxID=472963 RepID=A0A1S2ME20_9BACI|nr:DUF2533 family protein [Anaerobacillus alkalidiazotrophicus]OIJ22107.1 hypothetical protein BKP45_05375 [Anaerobacillus alkalidiazotrophicus]
MSVHLQIKKQMNNFINAEKNYRKLDQIREEKIEEIIKIAKNKKDFSLVEVNKVTEEINKLCKSHGYPLRKLVTKEMVEEFISRKV